MSNLHMDSATLRRLAYVALAGILYFAWFGGMVGLRSEHYALFLAMAAAYLANATTRSWLVAFSGLIAYWLIYDSLRVFPNYKFNPVHISEPYLFDKQWFGVGAGEARQTLNEYFAQHTHPAMDVAAALFYLSWVPVPFLFGVWLFRTNRDLFMQFTYGFLCANLVGFVGYYLYPAAPPWYVELNGFVLHPDTARSAAGLNNFDQLIGRPFFHNLYQRNSNVFAAIPSLHSAYPLVTLLYARQVREQWPKILFSVLCLGIWWAAVYLRHHYVIDVLLGMLTAVLGYLLAGRVLRFLKK